ncbi:TonB-dependent receptor [Chitinophaga lutea]|uniref:TonB-dependent receptor n=1 Tax=Chitinophaga lutea TaxID=2488634 RepID=A0A3N4PXS3_9BACT|nr:TonB-dependent receptor [Chitinophaga lutea]RPE12716.1 TonB-dependent receptor [Chitinophaga lutea]
MIRKFTLCYLLLLCSIVALARQSGKITGRVVDSNGGILEGVSIQVKGTTRGAYTNVKGEFEIAAEGEVTLMVTFLGYNTQEVKARPGNQVQLRLVPKNQDIDEVVVIGFGKQKKATTTGAINYVKAEELKDMPTASVTNALAGRLPGLISQQRTGLPGSDAALLYVRGFGTFNTAGQEPLVLVDGVERRFNDVDFNEVETISILKDASATAVFGVRGANGVILITTKRGVAGKPRVSMTVDNTLQFVTNLPQYLQSYDYATLYNEAYLNDGGDPNFMPFSQEALQKYKDHSDPYFYPDVNWHKEILKDYARQTQANVSISGGTSRARYFVAATYLDQDGLLKYGNYNEYNTNSTFKRYNFRSNVDLDVSPTLTVSMSLSGKHSRQTWPGNGHFFTDNPLGLIFWNMGRWAPTTAPVYNPNGSLGAFIEDNNIVGDVSRTGYSDNFRTDVEANIDVRHKMDYAIKGLSFRGKIVFDTYFYYTERRLKQYETFYYLRDPATGEPIYRATSKVETPIAFTSTGVNADKHVYGEAALDYSRTFDGKHAVTGLALFYADRLREAAAYPFSKLGWVGRVTYGYKSKYFGEFNMGYNGTENFAKGKRMGFFPSYSLAWILTEEPWMRPLSNWLGYTKIRFSRGKVGNSLIGNRRYLYLPDTWGNPGSAWNYRFGTSGTAVASAFELNLGNPDVTWETAWKNNLGLEFNLFNGITLNVDLFSEKRDNILLSRQDIPSLIGQTSLPPVNMGVMENKGYEIELKYDYKASKDLTFNIGGNYNFARNKILAMTEPQKPYPWMARTGKRYGERFGYIVEGFFNSQREVDEWHDQTTFGTVQPGDLKYRDMNGDSIINQFDIAPVGHPDVPEITYAISGGVKFKNWELQVQFQGVDNTTTFVNQLGGWDFYNSAKVQKHHLGRWTPETAATATYPRLTTSSTTAKNNYQPSSFWARDASFIRFKNLTIAYSLPKAWLQRLKMQRVRIYVNAANLYTWSKFDWFDPEIRSAAANLYPQMKNYNLGLNIIF